MKTLNMRVFQTNLSECYMKLIVSVRHIVATDLQATVFSAP